MGESVSVRGQSPPSPRRPARCAQRASASAELQSAVAGLKIAKLDAETASRAKTEFLANMSHEIRTPMTAILGFTENLFDTSLSDSERLNALQTIHRNGEHLLEVINDILDISKVEAGKLQIEHIACSPVQIVAEVKSLMQVRADAKGLQFNTEFVGAVPETIESDPTRLKQILVNLIGNAIKFTETGGIRLIARFMNTDRGAAESMMQIDIVDTGIGMAEEQMGKLFSPLRRSTRPRHASSAARAWGSVSASDWPNCSVETSSSSTASAAKAARFV